MLSTALSVELQKYRLVSDRNVTSHFFSSKTVHVVLILDLIHRASDTLHTEYV